MIDTILDVLTRICNANLAGHNVVLVPSTKIVRELAKILVNRGVIKRVMHIDNGLRAATIVVLKYHGVGPTRKPVLSGLNRISKPGRRVYRRAHKIPKVLGGYGLAIISTSKGLMTDKKARESRIGGEILCYIW